MCYLMAKICILAYYALIGNSLRITGIHTAYKNSNKNNCILLIGFTLVFISFIIAYMLREKYIYFWDYGSYWYMSLNVSAQMNFMSVPDFWRWLIDSINIDEYNILAAVLISIPL